MAREHKKIVMQYVILCEGIDTENFLISYLNSSELEYNKKFSETIQTFNFGGIYDLDTFILNLKNMEGFDKIKRLMILRDAENDVDQAIRMIKSTLRKAELPIPSECNSWETASEFKTAFTLMPLCNSTPEPGALEDLCWKILIDDYSVKDDVQTFVNEMKAKHNSIRSHEHKSKVHTFFSVNENFISLKTGEAAMAGAFNWSSPHLESLKALIEIGFEDLN